MFRSLLRLVGLICTVLCLYQGYLWWNWMPEAGPTDDVVRAIIQGNGDGSETVLWQRKD